jgi:hypothetical protein
MAPLIRAAAGGGDLDIVAAALLAAGSDRDQSQMPALGWLEQKARGVFERRTLAMGSPRHATLDVGDLEGDGDLDVVVGNMTTDSRVSAWVEVWENGCTERSSDTRSSAIREPPAQRKRQGRTCR